MPQSKPFYRTVRSIKEGPNSGYSSWAFVRDRQYAKDPQHFIRAYLLIQSDLARIFEFVEPSQLSKTAYSFRIHELLMRTCIEVEANFKAIMLSNGYQPELNSYGQPKWNMGVYRKVNISHHLSSYEVMLPIWQGDGGIFRPFESWQDGGSVWWYQTYNDSKHDRYQAFREANLNVLVSAVAGLLTLLTSQFGTETFSAGSTSIVMSGDDYHEMEPTIGEMFRIKKPDDWTSDEIYEFNWAELEKEEVRFISFEYSAVA